MNDPFQLEAGSIEQQREYRDEQEIKAIDDPNYYDDKNNIINTTIESTANVQDVNKRLSALNKNLLKLESDLKDALADPNKSAVDKAIIEKYPDKISKLRKTIEQFEKKLLFQTKEIYVAQRNKEDFYKNNKKIKFLIDKRNELTNQHNTLIELPDYDVELDKKLLKLIAEIDDELTFEQKKENAPISTQPQANLTGYGSYSYADQLNAKMAYFMAKYQQPLFNNINPELVNYYTRNSDLYNQLQNGQLNNGLQFMKSFYELNGIGGSTDVANAEAEYTGRNFNVFGEEASSAPTQPKEASMNVVDLLKADRSKWTKLQYESAYNKVVDTYNNSGSGYISGLYKKWLEDASDEMTTKGFSKDLLKPMKQVKKEEPKVEPAPTPAPAPAPAPVQPVIPNMSGLAKAAEIARKKIEALKPPPEPIYRPDPRNNPFFNDLYDYP